jgi:uncharacterized coiled-coil DUF342 family protein
MPLTHDQLEDIRANAEHVSPGTVVALVDEIDRVRKELGDECDRLVLEWAEEVEKLKVELEAVTDRMHDLQERIEELEQR